KPMDPQLLKWWFTTRSKHGLAVLGGYNGLVPIDVDTDDARVLRAVSFALPKASVIRRGSKGLMRFYRVPAAAIADVPRKILVMGKPDADGKRRPVVEVKDKGVAVIPPTLHRKTRTPYRWLTQRTLFNPFAEQLPVITPFHLEALARVLEPWCPAP